MCPRQRLDQRAIRLRLRARHKLAPVQRDDPFAAASTLEPHPDADDERAAVEPGLNAAHHAAFLSSCCRSSPTRLARPSALIRTRARSPARRPFDEELEMRACSNGNTSAQTGCAPELDHTRSLPARHPSAAPPPPDFSERPRDGSGDASSRIQLPARLVEVRRKAKHCDFVVTGVWRAVHGALVLPAGNQPHPAPFEESPRSAPRSGRGRGGGRASVMDADKHESGGRWRGVCGHDRG
jgi:hypothetical protein